MKCKFATTGLMIIHTMETSDKVKNACTEGNCQKQFQLKYCTCTLRYEFCSSACSYVFSSISHQARKHSLY